MRLDPISTTFNFQYFFSGMCSVFSCSELVLSVEVAHFSEYDADERQMYAAKSGLQSFAKCTLIKL